MRFYVDLLHCWGIIETEFVGFEEVSSWHGSLLVANHPSILDAVLIMTRVPSLDFMINARLLRHPVMGGAMRPCDFLRNDAPLSMIKSCKPRLGSGSNILIFPEGTRTVTPPLGDFYHGFALASTCANAPVRTIFIECDSDYFGHGFSFFKPAPCPIRFRLTAGRVFQPEPNADPRVLSATIEAYFRENLTRNPSSSLIS
jgi:1-acyl-sn-glycerol-3-phosphate acyltransferase